jgi:hypothetical protein
MRKQKRILPPLFLPAMLIKLSRHYVATSQGQRWNRIWVTTEPVIMS